nr:fas1 domain-containing protein [Quercus suber]
MKLIGTLVTLSLATTNCAQQLFVKSFIRDLEQQPMDPNSASPGIAIPPSSDTSHTPPGPPPNSDLRLSDVLGNQKQINIFAGYTRDISTVSTRLDDNRLNSTVLAPLNIAITSLPRKPWEDPEDYSAYGSAAYDGQDGEDRASRNFRRFTEAHVVTASPWREGEKARSMAGSEIWWENREGVTRVMPGDVDVERVASRVANGEVWVLKSALNYARNSG